MPHAVTHILIPIILLSLFRDLNIKNKKKFALHYVLIGGIAGIIPDLDVAVYYVLSFFGYSMSEIHRTFSHNIFVVSLFVILGFIALIFRINSKCIGRHRLRWSNIFFMIGFGVFIHLLLDYLIIGGVMLFYPISNISFQLNLINYIPLAWKDSFIPSLDAALLVLWLIYLEIKHRISDFI